MSRLLTVRQVASRLGVRAQTLANWRGRGIGPRYVKLNYFVRYPEDEVEAFVAARVARKVDDYIGAPVPRPAGSSGAAPAADEGRQP
ncbi:MAG TPA: helix-turn-helix domain-containing protein [Planctomycetota bacterium]|jgi:predicted DNA-binding transcriptional regulator AlpA|nr:helix-turn-helix domain-containing protein [Planctomycetota bacterium]